MHALAGPYALDALDGPERERFERHLRGCRTCESEVRGFATTAAALAMAAAIPPPARLRERVLAATAVTRQLPPIVARQGAAGGVSRVLRSPWVPRMALTVGAAGVAAAAVLAAVQVSTQDQLNEVQAHSQDIAAVLAAPDARIVSAPTSVGGTAIVVVSRTEAKVVVTSSGLPALPSSKVYELWLIGPSGTRPAGLLPAPSSGKTAPVLASGVRAGDKVGMTVEPAGGTSSPTTTPILLLPLSV
jgi:Anti-sigma-K factor rskA/Putative zinc-finger